MATRLWSVVFDANNVGTLAGFWSDALGWLLEPDDGYTTVRPADDSAPRLEFVPTSEPKRTKNRIHLDLPSRTDDEQHATVSRLLDLGARHADIGQRDVPWVVLADPEGNEFCVLPASFGAHAMPVGSISLDAADPVRMIDFWAAATGWPITQRGGPWALFPGNGPILGMGPPVAPKHGKNRVHIDVAPFVGDDQGAEVERLVALGARRADIGQGDVRWVVMADPEGNEFCVLTPR